MIYKLNMESRLNLGVPSLVERERGMDLAARVEESVYVWFLPELTSDSAWSTYSWDKVSTRG